jgi:hypothetical protein
MGGLCHGLCQALGHRLNLDLTLCHGLGHGLRQALGHHLNLSLTLCCGLGHGLGLWSWSMVII